MRIAHALRQSHIVAPKFSEQRRTGYKSLPISRFSIKLKFTDQGPTSASRGSIARTTVIATRKYNCGLRIERATLAQNRKAAPAATAFRHMSLQWSGQDLHMSQDGK
jgi:hypothetical protein